MSIKTRHGSQHPLKFQVGLLFCLRCALWLALSSSLDCNYRYYNLC